MKLRIDRLTQTAEQTRERHEASRELMEERLREAAESTAGQEEQTADVVAAAAWVEALVTDFASLDHGRDPNQNVRVSLSGDKGEAREEVA